VYNLEVEEHHTFLLENGVITHNCVDSLGYALAPLIRGKGPTSYSYQAASGRRQRIM